MRCIRFVWDVLDLRIHERLCKDFYFYFNGGSWISGFPYFLGGLGLCRRLA